MKKNSEEVSENSEKDANAPEIDKLSKQELQEFNKKQSMKGVCYLSNIPKKMKVMDMRSIFDPYNIEKIYLKPKKEIKKKQLQTIKNNKKNQFTEGWIEFTDKSVARSVALTFNGTPVAQKKRSNWSNDLWNIKYLPKFKWDNLTEQFVYDQKVRKQKLMLEVNKAKKKKDFFVKNFELSKSLKNLIHKKTEILQNDPSAQEEQTEQGQVNQENDKLKVKRKFIQKRPIK